MRRRSSPDTVSSVTNTETLRMWEPVDPLPEPTPGAHFVRRREPRTSLDEHATVLLVSRAPAPRLDTRYTERVRFLPATWPGPGHYGVEVNAKTGTGAWARRVVAYIVDRNLEDLGVIAWSMPLYIDSLVAAAARERRPPLDPVDVADPDRGFDVLIKHGAGRFTDVSLAPEPSPLGDDRWLRFAADHPLIDVLARTPRTFDIG
jgi:hypothetical protein